MNSNAEPFPVWQGETPLVCRARCDAVRDCATFVLAAPDARRFDFDPEAVVRLAWAGVRPINLPAPVRYFRADEGGVSHFRYFRDNRLLTWMHTRLFIGFVLCLPLLAARRLGGR